MEKILVVEDDEKINKLLNIYLTEEQYIVNSAFDGYEGIEMFKNVQYDLVVLDLMLPIKDGIEVIREIRKTSNVPVIMLTARSDEQDKLKAFNLGVDDYVTKPFSSKELLARIKAVLNRTNRKEDNSNIIKFNEISINIDSREVTENEKKVILTNKEYDLLMFLVKNNGITLSREQILNNVWGYDYMGDIRTVDTHVKQLRLKLNNLKECLETVWKIGYKFNI